MTLSFSGGNLILTGNSGEKLLDTSEGLFHATNFATDTVDGVVTFSSATATTTYSGGLQLRSLVERTTDTAVKNVESSATHCLGFMKVSWSGSSSPNGDIWFDASGTSVDTFDSQCTIDPRPSGGFLSGLENSRTYMTAIGLHTFYISGGQLRCKERLILRASTANSTVTSWSTTRPQATIQYRILCGFFL